MKIRAILTILGIACLVPLVLSGCSKPATQTSADSNIDYYTCTMHPSVHSKVPGKCPICSMDLVPVLKKKTAEIPRGNSAGITQPATGQEGKMPNSKTEALVGSSEFSVPVERQQQIGVTYATVEKDRFSCPSVPWACWRPIAQKCSTMWPGWRAMSRN